MPKGVYDRGYKRKIGISHYGYETITLTHHPMANKAGVVLIHRVIMSRKLGRWLRRDEHVHHIDGNRRNNNPTNLLVVSRSEHTKIHRGVPPDEFSHIKWKSQQWGTRNVSRGLCFRCCALLAGKQYCARHMKLAREKMRRIRLKKKQKIVKMA